MPWNTTVAVEREDKAIPANGEPYINEGVHIIKMKWAKLCIFMATLTHWFKGGI